MAYTKRLSTNKFNAVKKGKNCKECGIEFFPKNSITACCSYGCARLYYWKHKERRAKQVMLKICIVCGAEYERNPRYSAVQWINSKFCSLPCSAESQKINDGMGNQERGRRKRGQVKTGTQAWIDKIKARTKEGMMRPNVLEKLRQPKGPMSDDRKSIISKALCGKMPQNMVFGGTGAYPNVLRGDYECSKGTVYFRSKWEANYALYLDFLINQGEITNWEYEADVFVFEQIKFGTRSYRPDFKIFNTDSSIEYHEVKGYMDSRSKTKLKRMDLYYPDVKLILIERQFYTSIIKKLKGVIKFY